MKWQLTRVGLNGLALVGSLAACGCSLLDLADLGSESNASGPGSSGSTSSRSLADLDGGREPNGAEAGNGSAPPEAGDGAAADPSRLDASSTVDSSSISDSSSTSEASGDVDGGCATTFGGGRLLFSYDDPSSTMGWAIGGNGGGLVATTSWTGADGHSCPGAVMMTVPYQSYTTTAPDLDISYTPETQWSGATRLHLWMKLKVPMSAGYAALHAVQLFVQSSSFASYSDEQIDVGTILSDGTWHEVVMALESPPSGQPVTTSQINRLGAALLDFTSRPSGAPSSPTTATLLIDDVWLE